MIKKCIICGKEFEARKSDVKNCGKECSKEYSRRKALESYRRRKAEDPEKMKDYQSKYNKEYHQGGRRGYDQRGDKNNAFKTGIGLYAQKVKDKCEICGSTRFLEVHHKDRNRANNSEENLQTLCKSCHKKEHMLHDPQTGRFVGSK